MNASIHNVENAPARSRGLVALRRAAPIAALFALAGTIYALDLHAYLSLDTLREYRRTLTELVAMHSALAVGLYLIVYTGSTALSLPGGAALSIAGGFLFGGLAGGLYVILGATVGASLVFLAARTVLGNGLRSRAGPWFGRMESGFQKNAFSYLLTLRLIPLFPFFVVNLVPAFLGVGLRTYVLATAVGIIPGSLVFTFAGSGIGRLLDAGESFSVASILTPGIIGALTGLGLLSLAPTLYRR